MTKPLFHRVPAHQRAAIKAEAKRIYGNRWLQPYVKAVMAKARKTGCDPRDMFPPKRQAPTPSTAELPLEHDHLPSACSHADIRYIRSITAAFSDAERAQIELRYARIFRRLTHRLYLFEYPDCIAICNRWLREQHADASASAWKQKAIDAVRSHAKRRI